MRKLSEYDWYCDECNAFLNDQSGFDAYCKYWTCSECGHSNKIGKSEILFDRDEVNSFSDKEDEIPRGCAACGGPYPDCKSSCPLLDE